MPSPSFAVCISTYKRPQLLARLIGDLLKQSVLPQAILVVDGDPASGEVLVALRAIPFPPEVALLYLPSNHANLPYQRYLGWLIAMQIGWQVLVYLDDDLRASSPHAMRALLAPFLQDADWIGGTVAINYPNEALPAASGDRLAALAARLGSARGLAPGEMSPVGIRSLPERTTAGFYQVHWMHGGVMAFRTRALTPACFDPALFASYERRLGKGEDAILGRKANALGRLYFIERALFGHPGDDPPQAYPVEPYRLGYGIAYSRRAINDHYRGFSPPTLADRLALLKSYAGNMLILGLRFLLQPRREHLYYACGYCLGAVRGLLQKPSAERLTPGVDWQAEAQAALPRLQIIGKESAWKPSKEIAETA